LFITISLLILYPLEPLIFRGLARLIKIEKEEIFIKEMPLVFLSVSFVITVIIFLVFGRSAHYYLQQIVIIIFFLTFIVFDLFARILAGSENMLKNFLMHSINFIVIYIIEIITTYIVLSAGVGLGIFKLGW
jgi:hypothetical protein